MGGDPGLHQTAFDCVDEIERMTEQQQVVGRLSLEDFENVTSVDPIDVIRSVLAESGSLARFMEVHYLASEPELFAIMRMIA